jgi:hypothetical protein
VTAEIPKIVQQTGSGTASSKSNISPMDLVERTEGVVVATVTAAVCSLVSGTVSNGWVLLIFTAGAGGATGSGRMLMRAVSFFGPACVAEPG